MFYYFLYIDGENHIQISLKDITDCIGKYVLSFTILIIIIEMCY
jgi:hypothetical protein